MTCDLVALCLDANDPLRLARFWAGVLRWEMADDAKAGVALLPNDDTGFRIRFLPTQELDAGQSQLHFHVTSTSVQDQQETVARALLLGARHIDIGQRPEEGHVVLADPEGNDFCVIEPGNSFLAECGFFAEGGRARVRRRSGISGAPRWGGRWSGIRTRRRQSARRAAVPRSAGAVRR